MCVANLLQMPAKLGDKALALNPAARWLEKNYGIRPHDVIGRAAGYKRPNKFYQPGGGGYSGDGLSINRQAEHEANQKRTGL